MVAAQGKAGPSPGRETAGLGRPVPHGGLIWRAGPPSRVFAKKKTARGGLLGKDLERVMGIGPTWSAWRAEALPLCYTRIVGKTGIL